MSVVSMDLEPEVYELLRVPGKRAEDTLKEYLVLELYRRHQISAAKAAELLGMTRVEFIQFSGREGIPYFDMDASELADELVAFRGQA